jgi:hypothetical protein
VTGKKPVAPAPLEHDIQAAYITLVRLHRARYPALELLRAFPNGGARPWLRNAKGVRYSPVAQKLYDEGVEPGPPDIIFPVPSGNYVGLWFEFKRPREKLRPEQLEYMSRLGACGWRTDVQYDAEEAWRMTLRYLKGEG